MQRRSEREKKIPQYLKEYFIDEMSDIRPNSETPGKTQETSLTLPRTPIATVDIGARAKTPQTNTSTEHFPPMVAKADLLRSIAILEKENEDLELSVRFDELSKKNSDLKQRLLKKCDTVKSKPDKQDPSVDYKTKTDNKKADKLPSVKDLRTDINLSKKVDKLRKSCVIQLSDSDSSDSSDEDTQDTSKNSQGTNFYEPFPDKTKKKAISGEARASKDRVKLDVPWPHEFAQNVSLSYNDKDFGLTQLVRGEVFILLNVETDFSKSRQLHLLNLLYLAEKFPISEIKAYHAEVLRSIERGLKSWNDSFADEKYRTLTNPSTPFKRDNRYLICGAYQSGSCSFSLDHLGKFGDKKLFHSCRKCVRRGKNPNDSACRHPAKSCTVTDNGAVHDHD